MKDVQIVSIKTTEAQTASAKDGTMSQDIEMIGMTGLDHDAHDPRVHDRIQNDALVNLDMDRDREIETS